MTPERIETFRAELAASMSARVKVGLCDSIGLGIFTSDGRQIGVRVRETATEMLRLSDGGETWSDLWMDNLVGSLPTHGMRARIEQTCKLFGVLWENDTREIVTFVSPQEFASAAPRIGAASLAIDGWRPWLRGPAAERAARIDNVVRRVERLAHGRRWDFDRDSTVAGTKRPIWRPRATLRRNARQVVLAFLGEPDVESAAEHAMGWILDTKVPIVFLASSDVANDLMERDVLPKHTAVVPKQKAGTAEAILSAAEEIAEVA